MSLEACETIWTVCFVSKWVLLLFIWEFWCFSPRHQQEIRGRRDKLESFGNVQTPYPSDCWPHATSGPAGTRTLIWFLILAAFNSCLQMATTVGKIESLLPGRCNMHVCLISHRRGKKRWCCSNYNEPWLYETTVSVGEVPWEAILHF